MRRIVVSHGVVEQALHPIRCRVPACLANVQPFSRGRSLINPAMYFPAQANGCVRGKHGRNRPCSSTRFDTAGLPSMTRSRSCLTGLRVSHLDDLEAPALVINRVRPTPLTSENR
jgi:hypothetical protein